MQTTYIDRTKQAIKRWFANLRWAIFKKRNKEMKPETKRLLQVTGGDILAFQKFMIGFQNWLLNDEEAKKYFSNVKNFGVSTIEFWLPDERAIRLCITGKFDSGDFQCGLDKIEWVLQDTGAILRQWVPISREIRIKNVGEDNFVVFINGDPIQDPSQNYDEIIDYLMQIIPSTY